MSADWLILHGGALGDLVLTIQVALRLGRASGEGAIHLLSRADPGDLAACRPSVRRQSPEGLGLHWLFGEEPGALPERLRSVLAGRRVLNAMGGPGSALHWRLLETGARAVYSLDPKPQPGNDRHITEQWITQLEQQGLLVPKCVHQHPTRRSLGVPESLRQRGRQMLRCEAAERVAVVHPGSGGQSKCWPLRCFLETARRMQELGDYLAILVIGPVEEEKWAADDWLAIGGKFPLLRGISNNDLTAVLAAADVFIGNDAGPGHLAALLGTPIVSVFGATRADVWRPLGFRCASIQGDPAAADWGVAVDQVVATAAELGRRECN